MAQALLLFLLLLSTHIPSSTSDPEDESCLGNLHASLSELTNSLCNWTRTTFASPCNGFTSYLTGATCNNGRIYKLSFHNLSLSGQISPFLSNCTNLQSLDFSNSLFGLIPPDLQSLVNLVVLNLSSNRLDGPIPPQLAYCAYLNVIDLHSNLLTERKWGEEENKEREEEVRKEKEKEKEGREEREKERKKGAAIAQGESVCAGGVQGAEVMRRVCRGWRCVPAQGEVSGGPRRRKEVLRASGDEWRREM